MIGATALHTRAACDNCGEMPATREGPGATVLCDGCGAVRPANDDAQGAFCARPLCTRCNEPAFLRLKYGDLCSACFAISNSVASTPQDAKVTAAAPSALPQVAAAVTSPSKEPDALALLFCRPLRRSSGITKGDRPGTETSAPRQTTLESIEGLELNFASATSEDGNAQRHGITESGEFVVTSGRSESLHSSNAEPACNRGRVRDSVAVGRDRQLNSACGGAESRSAWGGFARSLHTGDVEAGIASGPQDSISDGAVSGTLPSGEPEPSVTLACAPSESALPQGGPPVTAAAEILRAPVSDFFDLEIDALVSGLEVGWALERRNSTTLRVVAASDSASNDISKSSIASI